MEKIRFTAPDTGENIDFFVLEQTTITGRNYILVTEEEQGDAECYIMREISSPDGTDVTYEFVEDDREYAAVGKVFGELLEDADLRFES